MIRRIVALASAAIALVAFGLPADASVDGPAPNTGTIVAGLTDVYAIVPAQGHIYLTPGPGGSSIAVMNPDGAQDGTIDGVAGASGAVAVNGTLYVAAFGASEIERFDLSTDPATQLSSLSTAPLSSPRDLRYAGGNLWFSTGCGTPNSHVGWMPLDGSSVGELTNRQSGWDSCTGLDANANAPNRIFVHDEQAGATTHLFEYAVGKPQPAFVARDPWSSDNYHGQSVTPLPGGDTFAMAWRDGNPSVFSMQDLHGPIGSYHGIGGHIAATDRNGGFVGATRTGSTAVPKPVKIWDLATRDPAVQFTFRDDYPRMLGPLAFSPNGKALYVVTTSPPDTTVVFRVLDPTQQDSSVYVQVSDDSIDAGDVTDVVVHLETPGTNRDVTLMASPWKDLATFNWIEIGTHTVDASGNTTFHVSPTRNTYYSAEYAGDAVAAPSGGSGPAVMVTATVTGQMQGASSVVNGVAHYDDTDSVSYAMHVVPDDLSLSFHVHVEVASNGAWLPFTSTDVAGDGSGDGTATFTPDVFGPGRYRVSASSYGSVLVANGQGPWTRFVVDP